MPEVRKRSARPAAPQSAACWSCRGPVASASPFCGVCGAIQPPAAGELFARLGLDPSFDVDMSALEQTYFERQRLVHPDRFASGSAREREYSMRHTANLNEAFQTLASPLRRAEYLLALRGHPVRGSAEETVDDEELLTRAMEMRETLAEAESLAAIAAVHAGARAERDACLVALQRAFAADEMANARALTLKLTYLQKFAEEAREREVRAQGASAP